MTQKTVIIGILALLLIVQGVMGEEQIIDYSIESAPSGLEKFDIVDIPLSGSKTVENVNTVNGVTTVRFVGGEERVFRDPTYLNVLRVSSDPKNIPSGAKSVTTFNPSTGRIYHSLKSDTFHVLPEDIINYDGKEKTVQKVDQGALFSTVYFTDEDYDFAFSDSDWNVKRPSTDTYTQEEVDTMIKNRVSPPSQAAYKPPSDEQILAAKIRSLQTPPEKAKDYVVELTIDDKIGVYKVKSVDAGTKLDMTVVDDAGVETQVSPSRGLTDLQYYPSRKEYDDLKLAGKNLFALANKNGGEIKIEATGGNTYTVTEDKVTVKTTSGERVLKGSAELRAFIKDTERQIAVGDSSPISFKKKEGAQLVEKPTLKEEVKKIVEGVVPDHSDLAAQVLGASKQISLVSQPGLLITAAQPVASTNIKVGELYENDAGFFYVTDVSDKDKIQVDFYKKDGTSMRANVYAESALLNIQKKGVADNYVLGAIPSGQRLDAIKSLTSSGNFEGVMKTLKNMRDETPTASLTFQNNKFSISYIDTSSEDRIKERTDVFNVQSGERTIHSEEIVTKDKVPSSKTETTETQKLDGDTLKPLSTKKEYFALDDKGKFTSVMSFTNDHSPADSATSMALKQKLEGKMRDWEKANTAFEGEQNEQNQNTLDLADKELKNLQQELKIAQSTKSVNQILTRLSGNTYITETFEKDGKKSYKSYKIGTDGSLEEVSPAEVYFAADKESRKEGLFSSLFLSDAAKDIMNELQKEGAIGSFLGIERSTMSSAAQFIGGLLSASEEFSGLSALSNLIRSKDLDNWKQKVYKEFTNKVVGMEYFKSELCAKKFKTSGGQSFVVRGSAAVSSRGAYIHVDKSELTKVRTSDGLVDGFIYRVKFYLTNPNEQNMVYNIVFKKRDGSTINWFSNNRVITPSGSVKQTDADLTSKDKTIVQIFPSKADYVEACLTFSPPLTTLSGKKVSKECSPITIANGVQYTSVEKKRADDISTTSNDGAAVIAGD